MSEGASLVVLGVFLLAGYAAHGLGRRMHVPRVTLLLLMGLLAGPAALDLVPHEVSQWFPMVGRMSLGIVGFLLGEQFLGSRLRATGRVVLSVSVTHAVVTALAVGAALVVAGAPAPLALVLAGIATATAPAATLDLVRESGSAGPLTDTVLGVVAIDDAWGVILFAVLLVAAEGLTDGQGTGREVLVGLWEVVGAVGVGLGVGLPMIWLTGRVRAGEPALVEGMGFVFLCAGIAGLVGASYLLACMVLGTTVANGARHYTRPFHAIEGVREPFLSIFFLLAGFSLEPQALAAVGLFGVVYVLARVAGRLVGGTLGAWIGRAPPVVRRNVGFCLLPQAGVALGLALLARERLPALGDAVLPLVIAATVFFELVGPPVTHGRLRAAGETGRQVDPDDEEALTDREARGGSASPPDPRP